MSYVTNASASTEAKSEAGAVTANTGSKTLAAANRDRIALYLTNTGANAVWLSFGKTAVAEKGIYLAKEGGSAVVDDYVGIVTVITKSGESLVTLSEV
jgi:hypothetical protein